MKASHKAIQARVDAITPRNAPYVPSTLSVTERRAIIVRQLEGVKKQLSGLKKGSFERRSLAETYKRLEEEVKLVPKHRKEKGLESWFIDGAMSILTKTQVMMIWDKAKELKDAWGKENNPGPREHPWKTK